MDVSLEDRNRQERMFMIPSMFQIEGAYDKSCLIKQDAFSYEKASPMVENTQPSSQNLIEMPHFIPRKNIKSSSILEHKIPKKIFQTWKSRYLTEKVYNHVRKLIDMNPDYDYYLFGDYECREYLKRYFTSEYLAAFDDIVPGAFKADFWRYAVLYREGGVYIDIDLDILYPLDSFIPKDTDFVSVKDRCPPTHPNGIYQAFIATIPLHDFLSCSLQLCLSNVQSIYYDKQTCLGITGPRMMGTAMNGALKRDVETGFSQGEFSFKNTKGENSKYKLYIFSDVSNDIRNENNVLIMNNKIDDYVQNNSYSILSHIGGVYKSCPSFFIKYKYLCYLIILVMLILILIAGIKYFRKRK